jgi:uncharacterized protein
MTRILFWLALALLVYFAIRSKLKQSQRRQQHEQRQQWELQQRQRASARQVAPPEAMLQCAECHTYFPASEALTAADGATYCCDQHRRRHAAR